MLGCVFFGWCVHVLARLVIAWLWWSWLVHGLVRLAWRQNGLAMRSAGCGWVVPHNNDRVRIWPDGNDERLILLLYCEGGNFAAASSHPIPEQLEHARH
jgi:hypothetical protein